MENSESFQVFNHWESEGSEITEKSYHGIN